MVSSQGGTESIDLPFSNKRQTDLLRQKSASPPGVSGTASSGVSDVLGVQPSSGDMGSVLKEWRGCQCTTMDTVLVAPGVTQLAQAQPL